MPPTTVKHLALGAARHTIPAQLVVDTPLSTAPVHTNALLDAIVTTLTEKLNIDELAGLLVDQVTDRLVDSITLSDLADTVATQHKDEINARLAQVVLARAGKRA